MLYWWSVDGDGGQRVWVCAVPHDTGNFEIPYFYLLHSFLNGHLHQLKHTRIQYVDYNVEYISNYN